MANLSHLPEAVLELVRRALRGEPVASVPQTVKIRRPCQHAAVADVVRTIRKLGLDQALYSRSADWVCEALAAFVMRIRRPSSKPHLRDPQRASVLAEFRKRAAFSAELLRVLENPREARAKSEEELRKFKLRNDGLGFLQP